MSSAARRDADAEFGEPGVVGPWAAHLPGQELVPAYFVSRFAAQYRVVVDVLLEAQDTSLTGLSFDDVLVRVRAALAARLPADVAAALVADHAFSLDARLDQLVRWGVLTRWQDPARTGEDFLCRRDRYQLTPASARLHAFGPRRRRRTRTRRPTSPWRRGRSATG